jgi:hypothetical protein
VESIHSALNITGNIMTNVIPLIKRQPQRASNMDSGFVLYFRSIVKKDWYKNDIPKRIIFEHCLNVAQYSLYESTFHNRTLTLEAGQLHTTFSQLASDSGLLGFYQHPLVNCKNPESASKKAVERILEYFTKDGCLSYETFGLGKNKTTVITISNWSDFQSGHVPNAVPKLVPNKPLTGKGSYDTPVPNAVPNSVTENNNTLSKDRVEDTCSEQSSEPEKKLTNIVLPLNKKDTFHQVSQEDFDEYLELYPAVDVMQQLRLMYRWFKDNPKRKKTKSGIQRFISSWLGKEQNKGGSYSSKQTVDHNDTSWADGFKVKL